MFGPWRVRRERARPDDRSLVTTRSTAHLVRSHEGRGLCPQRLGFCSRSVGSVGAPCRDYRTGTQHKLSSPRACRTSGGWSSACCTIGRKWQRGVGLSATQRNRSLDGRRRLDELPPGRSAIADRALALCRGGGQSDLRG